jgi:hypothetical protein
MYIPHSITYQAYWCFSIYEGQKSLYWHIRSEGLSPMSVH